MKKIIIPAVLGISIISCTPQIIPPHLKEVKNIEIDSLPKWVLKPDVEYGVGAVGISSKSRGGFRVQIKKAEMDAKANIANKIQSEISQVTKEALRESNVNGINDIEEIFSQATKEVTKSTYLSGVSRVSLHQDKEGNLYVHMVLSDKDYSRFLRNSQRMYEQRLKNANLGRDNLNKSQEAVKELFDELEKEREKN